jgi:hypothetical protein
MIVTQYLAKSARIPGKGNHVSFAAIMAFKPWTPSRAMQLRAGRTCMRAHAYFLWAALTALPLGYVGAEAATLRVCKVPKVVVPDYDKPIRFPAGELFADMGSLHEKDPANPDFHGTLLVTTEALVLSPKQKCVTVSAKVAANPHHDKIGPAGDRRYARSYGSSGFTSGPYVDLDAWALSNF